MNSKFKEMFEARVKDYGLSDKALGELEERSVSLIGDDESDEAKLTTQVDFLDGIAKAMQGEVTRKVQAAKTDTRQTPPKKDDDDAGGKKKPNPKDGDDPVMAQLKALQEAVRTLTEANAKSEQERKLKTREEMVREAARKAQLDQKFLQFIDTSKVETREDADKLLSELKQTIVNASLPPKTGNGRRAAAATEADKKAAEAFAKTLKDL